MKQKPKKLTSLIAGDLVEYVADCVNLHQSHSMWEPAVYVQADNRSTPGENMCAILHAGLLKSVNRVYIRLIYRVY